MIVAVFAAGGVLAVLVGGPIWLGVAYAALGLLIPLVPIPHHLMPVLPWQAGAGGEFRAATEEPDAVLTDSPAASLLDGAPPSQLAVAPAVTPPSWLPAVSVQRARDSAGTDLLAEIDVLDGPDVAEDDLLEAPDPAEDELLQALDAAEDDALQAPDAAEDDALQAPDAAEDDALQAPDAAEDDVLDAPVSEVLDPPRAPQRTAAAASEPTIPAAVRPPEGSATSRAADEEGPRVVRALPSARATGEASALGYVFVSRTDAGDSGSLSTEADATIDDLCQQRRLSLMSIARDVDGPGRARPALRWALDQLAAGKAQTLVVARLAHLSDTAAALSHLLRWLDEHERTLIAVDFGLDTSTESGRLAAEALVRVGGWEHERISARTRRGLAAARSRGAGGRAAVADVPELMERIRQMRAEGMTLQAIADVLNAEGIPTLRGGAKWRPSSVQAATGYRRPSSNSKRLDLPPGAPQGRGSRSKRLR